MLTPRSRLLTDPIQSVQESLNDHDRLLELANSRLEGSLPEDCFDRYTRLAARTLKVPIALISVITPTSQYLKSNFGLTLEPFCDTRDVPVSSSICKYVVHTEKPLVLWDTHNADFLRDSGVPIDFVRSYIGYPLTVNGQTLGSLCAIHTSPHPWSDEDLQVMKDIAEAVEMDINYRNNSCALNLAIQELVAVRTELYNYAKGIKEPNDLELPDMSSGLSMELAPERNPFFVVPAMNRTLEEVKNGSPFALVSIRFDSFERILPQAGQEIRNRFIAACIRQIRKFLATKDELVFVDEGSVLLILEEFPPGRAQEWAGHLRETFFSYRYHDSRKDFSSTVSIGVLKLDKKSTFPAVVTEVERMSLAIKTRGGDKVEIA